ncbi:hypothetical protein OJF2_74440 [Aquisphaera giovannonii]|uniref:Uncharacterized protein n=1 Tax=Aquisphaera giovannonii TaxID=406548 RepID=A0A5B9WF23_9BACT|nr:hypothetical protein [Aquisphaera giovannonii]QEH38834.1 hypothetical protein OJF2_74440 [Aquisphaera giovannonii]
MAIDERLAFSFNATRPTPDGRRADASRAVVKVGPCLAFQFGHPNDEALPGHPLYDRGFEGVAVHEVLESPRIAEPARQNRVRFPGSDLAARAVRHFLSSSSESTLEVLGNGLDVSVSDDPLEVIVGREQAWLFREPAL